jgi:hypothetical protein
MTDSALCLWLYDFQNFLTWGDFGYLLRAGLPLVVMVLLARWAFGYQRHWIARWGDLRWPLALLIPTFLAQLARTVWFVVCYAP